MPYKNKEERVSYAKAWREANKYYAKAWREVNKDYDKVYCEANKERLAAFRKANKKKKKVYDKTYREAHPDRINAKVARRKALKLKLIPKHLKNCREEKQRVLVIYKLCLLMSKATGVQHHVDHMWPLSDKGPEWSGNMQIITAQENFSKGAKVCPELKRNILQSLMEITNDI